MVYYYVAQIMTDRSGKEFDNNLHDQTEDSDGYSGKEVQLFYLYAIYNG